MIRRLFLLRLKIALFYFYLYFQFHYFKVDCTAEKATCDKFGVGGFPTLKIFRHGEVSAEYDGPREAEGIVKVTFKYLIFLYVDRIFFSK